MRKFTRTIQPGGIGLLLLPALLAGAAMAAGGEGEVAVTVEDVWPLGEVREYRFEMSGQPMGRQWNQMLALDDPGAGGGYRLDFTLELSLSAIGQPDSLKMDGIYELTPEGRPLAYRLNVALGEEQQHLDIAMTDSTIEATVVRDGAESRHILPRLHDIFLVDNNMIGQWGLMLALIPLHSGEPMAGRIFVPQALTEMDILVEIDPGGPVPAPETDQLAYRCRLAPIGETCWVTPEGRLVRLEDEKQHLVVTLLPPQ